MTLFEALMGGAFDHLNWQHSRELDRNFSKKSNAPGFAWGVGGVGWLGGFGIDQYITASCFFVECEGSGERSLFCLPGVFVTAFFVPP